MDIRKDDVETNAPLDSNKVCGLPHNAVTTGKTCNRAHQPYIITTKVRDSRSRGRHSRQTRATYNVAGGTDRTLNPRWAHLVRISETDSGARSVYRTPEQDMMQATGEPHTCCRYHSPCRADVIPRPAEHHSIQPTCKNRFLQNSRTHFGRLLRDHCESHDLGGHTTPVKRTLQPCSNDRPSKSKRNTAIPRWQLQMQIQSIRCDVLTLSRS